MKALLSLLVTCSLALSQDCWSPHTPGRYITGAQVSRLNHNYQANWSTSETPGAENWGGWQDIGQCENSSNTTADPCWTTFSEAMHVTGAEVSYLGFNYRANWTTSETPGVENWGGWIEIGECNADPILLSDLSLSDVSIEEAAGDNAIIGYFSTNLGSSEAIVYRLVVESAISITVLFISRIIYSEHFTHLTTRKKVLVQFVLRLWLLTVQSIQSNLLF